MNWFLKILGIVGLLSVKLQEAAVDNKITVNEGIEIIKVVCEALGIDFDDTGLAVD